MAALIFEMDWFRLLAQIIGPSVDAFAVMLAVYLLGIGLGSLLAAGIVRRIADPGRPWEWGCLRGPGRLWGHGCTSTSYRCCMAGFSCGCPPRPLPSGTCSRRVPWRRWQSCRSPWDWGSSFRWRHVPVAAEAGSEEATEDAPVGGLLFLNTLGGVVGCLLAGFELLPHLGVSPARWASPRDCCCARRPRAVTAGAGGPSAPRRRRPGRPGGGWAADVLAPPTDEAVMTAGVYSEMLNREAFRQRLAQGRGKVFGGDLMFLQEGINNAGGGGGQPLR